MREILWLTVLFKYNIETELVPEIQVNRIDILPHTTNGLY